MPPKKKITDKVDKRLRQKIVVGNDIDGKPIIKYASGKTKKELAQNVDELKKRYIGGVEVQRDMLFGAYVIAWYEAYKKPGLSAGSIQTYKSILNKHILPAFEDCQLRAITAANLQKFINGKAGMSVSALGYMHSILTNVFKRAYAEGIIDRNPAVALGKPAATKKSRRALTDAEAAAALKVGQEHPEGLILLVLYYTGMRIGEALGLQWQDVDFAERLIHVRRDIDYKTQSVGTLKTKASERSVPMPDELVAALEAVRGVGSAFVFQAPTSTSHDFLPQSTLKRRWERLMVAMYEADKSIPVAVLRTRKGKPLPDGKPGPEVEIWGSMLTPHYFRHNYASVLYNADVDVLSAQRFLGHADPKTTLEIYSHLSKAKEDSNAEKVREALSKKVAKRLPENDLIVLDKKTNP